MLCHSARAPYCGTLGEPLRDLPFEETLTTPQRAQICNAGAISTPRKITRRWQKRGDHTTIAQGCDMQTRLKGLQEICQARGRGAGHSETCLCVLEFAEEKWPLSKCTMLVCEMISGLEGIKVAGLPCLLWSGHPHLSKLAVLWQPIRRAFETWWMLFVAL